MFMLVKVANAIKQREAGERQLGRFVAFSIIAMRAGNGDKCCIFMIAFVCMYVCFVRKRGHRIN